MYAVIANLSFAEGRFEASRKVLHDTVVPQVSKIPGFAKGYWTASLDQRSGTTIVIFKTQSDADNAAKNIRNQPPPAPGVTVGTVEIREILAEA